MFKTICVILGLISNFATVQAADLTLQTAPTIDGHFAMNGLDFSQSVKVVFTPALDIQKIRELSENTELMKDLSDWVPDAAFKMVGQDQQFWLTIGKSGAKFTHMFHCKEEMSATTWSIACNEDASLPDGKKFLTAGSKNMQCTNATPEGATQASTTCTYEMKGQASDQDFFLFHFTARRIAFDLFEETVNYLAGLSYIAVGAANDPADIKKHIVSTSVYAPFLKEIDKTTDQVKAADAEKPISLDFSSQKNQIEKRLRVSFELIDQELW